MEFWRLASNSNFRRRPTLAHAVSKLLILGNEMSPGNGLQDIKTNFPTRGMSYAGKNVEVSDV